MLSRIAEWTTAFEKFLEDSSARVFGYGSFDCCSFAADGVRAITGTDIAAVWRGHYRSRFGALRCLRRLGPEARVAAAMERAASMYGIAEVPLSFAQRGDLVLIERGRGDQSLGLVTLDGSRVAVVCEAGIGYVPLGRAARAWRI